MQNVLKHQVFAEREAVHRVHGHTARQITLAFRQFQHRTARKHHIHRRIIVIDVFDVGLPMLVFVYLVEKKMRPTMRVMIFYKVCEGVVGKPHVVQRHIQHPIVVKAESLLNALFEQCRFSHAFRPFDANNTSFPIDAMQQLPLEFHAHLLDASL